jgi:ABC-2 type transport system permease protein
MRGRDILRQLRLLPAYLRLSLLSILEHRIQLWGAFFSSIVNIVVYVIFWNVITLQVPVLTGVGWVVWGRGELTFLLGMSEVTWGFGSFFWMGIWEIHWYITEIGIEEYQIRPVNTIYQLLARNFWFGGLVQIALGIVMLGLSSITFGLTISFIGIILGILALLLGEAALYILWASLACLAFWIGRNEGLLELSDAVESKFTRMPIDIMPRTIQQFLTFVLPVIFLASVPTMLVLGQLPLEIGVLYIGIAIILLTIWIFIFRYLWAKGLRRYQPVGG